MTTLYIIRHAYAGEHGDPRYPDDSVRPLTPQGANQFRKAVKKLVKRGLAPEVVATSPLVRCRQTAGIVCDRVESAPELIELDALAPGSDLEALVEWTNSQQADVLAWVGHAPDVDRLAAALLGAHEGALRFKKGAVAALEFREAEVAPGSGELQYLLAPAELGCRRKSDD